MSRRNRPTSIFHGANSVGVATNGNRWSVSPASMDFEPRRHRWRSSNTRRPTTPPAGPRCQWWHRFRALGYKRRQAGTGSRGTLSATRMPQESVAWVTKLSGFLPTRWGRAPLSMRGGILRRPAGGQTFSFQWGVNFDSGGGNKGFNIFAGTNQVANVNMGGSPKITFNGSNTGIAYGTNPMTWSAIFTAPGSLEVTSTGRTNGGGVVFRPISPCRLRRPASRSTPAAWKPAMSVKPTSTTCASARAVTSAREVLCRPRRFLCGRPPTRRPRTAPWALTSLGRAQPMSPWCPYR